MTRTEKNALKKKAKELGYLAYGMIILFVIVLVVILNIDPFEGQAKEEVSLLLVTGVVFGLITPLFAGLGFNFASMSKSQELRGYRYDLQIKRQQVKIEILWNAIKGDDIQKMKDTYNSFSDAGGYRALANGIVTTALLFKGNPKDQAKADKRMTEYYTIKEDGEEG